jgi:hypothetical protein
MGKRLLRCCSSSTVKSVGLSSPPRRRTQASDTAYWEALIAEVGSDRCPEHGRQSPERTGWGHAVWEDVCVRFATGSKKRLACAVILLCRYSPVRSRALFEILGLSLLVAYNYHLSICSPPYHSRGDPKGARRCTPSTAPCSPHRPSRHLSPPSKGSS